MGASPTPFRRWLWLALPLLAVMVAVLAGGAPLTADGSAPTANSTIFLPSVIKPSVPRLELVPFVVGFEDKTIMDIVHAGDERLFVANREGKVWVVYPDGRIPEPPFLDVSDQVEHERNFEQGLLGLAFHPDYPVQPYFYFAFTSSHFIVVMRGEVSANNPDLADPESLVTLLDIRKPTAGGGPSPVHNGGDLAFGPDGYLYIPVGDGGPDPFVVPYLPGDPFNHSQDRDTMFGSILRIDPNPTRGLKPDCGDTEYSIPRDNPWLGDDGCDEIWVKGVRNPWRMSIDALTGDIYFGDVGEWKREEINVIPADSPGGLNFGWHCYEGTVNYSTIWEEVAETCDYVNTEFVPPTHEYDHSQGECSVIGGIVYRGDQFPAFRGNYFFGDWCSGRLWTMASVGGQWQVNEAGDYIHRYSTFGEDVHGELYAGTYESGMLYKVVIR